LVCVLSCVCVCARVLFLRVNVCSVLYGLVRAVLSDCICALSGVHLRAWWFNCLHTLRATNGSAWLSGWTHVFLLMSFLAPSVSGCKCCSLLLVSMDPRAAPSVFVRIQCTFVILVGGNDTICVSVLCCSDWIETDASKSPLHLVPQFVFLFRVNGGRRNQESTPPHPLVCLGPANYSKAPFRFIPQFLSQVLDLCVWIVRMLGTATKAIVCVVNSLPQSAFFQLTHYSL
jgi:hypothetical protein